MKTSALLTFSFLPLGGGRRRRDRVAHPDLEGGRGARGLWSAAAGRGRRGSRRTVSSRIGDLRARRAGVRIDVVGLAVVPDSSTSHSHAVEGVFGTALAENYLKQGVTTVGGRSRRSSPYPIGEFLGEARRRAPATSNFALMVGHGTDPECRPRQRGSARPSRTPELERMKTMVAVRCARRAFGLSRRSQVCSWSVRHERRR